MTTDDIIRIALEAGAELYADTLLVNGKDAHDFIKRFAALVAAAELRRLHAQAAQDEALLRQALEALEISTRFVYADMRPQCEDAIAALRERLDEGEQR